MCVCVSVVRRMDTRTRESLMRQQSSVTTIVPQIWLVDLERSIEWNRHWSVPYCRWTLAIDVDAYDYACPVRLVVALVND